MKLSRENPRLGNKLTLIERVKQLGIKTAKLTNKNLERSLEETIYNNEKIQVEINLSDLKFGHNVSYKHVIREYQIKYIEGLREIVESNKLMYENDKNRYVIEKTKESNGFS